MLDTGSVANLPEFAVNIDVSLAVSGRLVYSAVFQDGVGGRLVPRFARPLHGVVRDLCMCAAWPCRTHSDIGVLSASDWPR